MKMEIDTGTATLRISGDPAGDRQYPLYSREAFEAVSRMWLKIGWNEKYPYTFSWLGQPIIQLPMCCGFRK